MLHSQLILWDRWGLRDVAINLLLYLPFGAAAFLALSRGRRRVWAVAGATAAGTLLSATLEMLQAYAPGRDPSLSDVAPNTLGAAAGALTAMILGHRLAKLHRGGRRCGGAPRRCWCCSPGPPFSYARRCPR